MQCLGPRQNDNTPWGGRVKRPQGTHSLIPPPDDRIVKRPTAPQGLIPTHATPALVPDMRPPVRAARSCAYWEKEEPQVVEGLEFRPDIIDDFIMQTALGEAAWQDFFASVGAVPHVVVYEGFVQRQLRDCAVAPWFSRGRSAKSLDESNRRLKTGRRIHRGAGQSLTSPQGRRGQLTRHGDQSSIATPRYMRAGLTVLSGAT